MLITFVFGQIDPVQYRPSTAVF